MEFSFFLLLLSVLLLTIPAYSYSSRITYQEANPGFGTQLGDLIEDVPDLNYNTIGPRWTDASFGKLVSELQDRKDLPAIRNMF
jgi:hypothetical protein